VLYDWSSNVDARISAKAEIHHDGLKPETPAFCRDKNCMIFLFFLADLNFAFEENGVVCVLCDFYRGDGGSRATFKSEPPLNHDSLGNRVEPRLKYVAGGIR